MSEVGAFSGHPRVGVVSNRQTIQLQRDWLFSLGDHVDAAQGNFDDTRWTAVTVPHDWAIGRSFDKEIDIKHRQEEVDGRIVPYERTGETGALPHPGVGWYRRRLNVSEAWAGKRLLLRFDGAMSHSRVYVNGHEVGYRPYGYSSFEYDITDFVQAGADNVVAVRIDNLPLSSRWYPGAGLYRPVYLTVVHPVHVPTWGTYITTPRVTDEAATVRMSVDVRNTTDTDRRVRLNVGVAPVGGDGERVGPTVSLDAPVIGTVPAGTTETWTVTGTVDNPRLWDVTNPQLYTATCELYLLDDGLHNRETESAEDSLAGGVEGGLGGGSSDGLNDDGLITGKPVASGKPVDAHTTRFGIRAMAFHPQEGFLLNGHRVRLNGVCMHHDLGALGAAVHRRALERQLALLQSMGCNAIRTSHNPPAVELLDLCDEMGFLVIDEAFDEWRYNKGANSYAFYFDDWAERDLTDMIVRDRNHPSVIMWSIGNEVSEQHRDEGAETTRFLANICRRLDPTRPVTAGFHRAQESIDYRLVQELDVVGWNYEYRRYDQWLAQFPDMVMYGAETESSLSSRGEYFLPVTDGRNVMRSSLHCSAYDTESTPWGSPPDYELLAQERHPRLLGQFTWTGFDYLGEPTPYGRVWPARSSYFGIFDLAGFPKDRYYLYRSVWSEKPTLHLLPHWNWHGQEGEPIPVHCFTSFPAAELFLNGRSMGVRRKASAEDDGDASVGLGWPYTRFRLMWDVPYEPGTLEVVALDRDGCVAMRHRVVTADIPAQMAMVPDRSVLRPDGEDLAFVTVRITDKNGHFCAKAAQRVHFHIEGPGRIVALDNGDPTDLEPFHATNRRTFNGLCLVIVRTNPGEKGLIVLRAEADGLQPAVTTIDVR